MRKLMLSVLSLSILVMFATQALADDCAPAKVTNLAVGTGKTTAVLEWTDPGNDCNTGTASSYEIRRSSSTITDTNWQSATVVATGTPAGSNGTGDCRQITGLTCEQTYYYVIFHFDAAGNRSPISNCVSGTQASCSFSPEVDC
ncbi:MAG: hypothetical protein IT347_11655 [Candidatus Eisenbacteria bacterium]|nr:hypothetical protein [Candidatus Eisenbacteria bacterium]